MILQTKEVLRQMEERDQRKRPVPFTLQFVTASGEVVEMENVVLAKSIGSAARSTDSAARSTDSAARSTGSAPKQANQFDNAMRNIYQLDSKQIRKVYIWAITGFNHQTVVY